MSTQAPPAIPATAGTDKKEIRIVSHSNLFYWWPVWAICFVLALLTWFDDYKLAVVPEGTTVEHRLVENRQQDVLVTPPGKTLPADAKTGKVENPRIRISDSKSYGVLFLFVLVLVILFTNVPLRGLWSIVVLVTVVLLAIIFRLAGWWGPIINALDVLHIYINMAGYLSIGVVLLFIWLITFLLFDPQVYMVFTPGQLRVRQEIGGGEAAYDTAGMVVQKQRNDLFRHWILGLGSGDLIVNTSGAHAHHFDLPNVLFVGHKVRQIEEMLRERPVVRG